MIRCDAYISFLFQKKKSIPTVYIYAINLWLNKQKQLQSWSLSTFKWFSSDLITSIVSWALEYFFSHSSARCLSESNKSCMPISTYKLLKSFIQKFRLFYNNIVCVLIFETLLVNTIIVLVTCFDSLLGQWPAHYASSSHVKINKVEKIKPRLPSVFSLLQLNYQPFPRQIPLLHPHVPWHAIPWYAMLLPIHSVWLSNMYLKEKITWLQWCIYLSFDHVIKENKWHRITFLCDLTHAMN